MSENYEVQNEVIQAMLKKMGKELHDKMPKRWGFALLIFDFNTESGSMFYLSDAERETMIKAMKEFISKNE